MPIAKQLTPDKALAKMQEICAMQEICTTEALAKLRKYGIHGATAAQIVAQLVETRFIDDDRFIRAFVRDKFLYARWGRLKIRQALRLKRLDSSAIDCALDEEIDEDTYFENLAAALRSKAKNMPDKLDHSDKEKLARFAAGRGYEPKLIFEMLPEEDYWRNV